MRRSTPPFPLDHTITRRSLLGAAAGSAALLATRGLPAWARPVAFPAGVRQPESLPFPGKPAGTPSMPEIEHIVVLMMENHSFDNLLGMVPHQVAGRASVDGWRFKHGKPVNFNLDASGNKVIATHAGSPCQLDGAPSQSWDASHESYDNGLNDGFVKASGPMAMRFWDKTDIPFTYSLVEHFPIGERYFCSVLGQTFPNRAYLFAGTSQGRINDTLFSTPPANGTIWDRLDAHGINWGIYSSRPATRASCWSMGPTRRREWRRACIPSASSCLTWPPASSASTSATRRSRRRPSWPPPRRSGRGWRSAT
ncbi:MAG: alkaline phosphatase family protein, partial [Solirubrobacteraceae bacterium]